MGPMGTRPLVEASPRQMLPLGTPPYTRGGIPATAGTCRKERPGCCWCRSSYRPPGLSPMEAGPLSVLLGRTTDPSKAQWGISLFSVLILLIAA